MGEMRLGVVEARFADIIWENEPLQSGELVKLCAEKLDWKKSTTYTMLRRLCQRGIFENADGTVRVLQTREQFQSGVSERFVEEEFGGSLPGFLAAFTCRKKLSEKEIAELEQLIADARHQRVDS